MTRSAKVKNKPPRHPASRLHCEIIDALMTETLQREPKRHFTLDMVRPSDRAAFQGAFDRLIKLGCLPNTLLYCLSYVHFHGPEPLPTAAGMRSLAKRMREVADAIHRVEGAGYISPFDADKLEGLSIDDLAENAWYKPIAQLPHVLAARAADYERCAAFIVDHPLRRDLVGRASRLAPSVYVKHVTARQAEAREEAEIRLRQQTRRQRGERRLRNLGREPDATSLDQLSGVHPRSFLIEEHRAKTVAKLISASGITADAGTLHSQLREFEVYYLDAAGILLGKLMSHHRSEATASQTKTTKT